MEAPRPGEHAPPAAALVVRHRVHGLSAEMRPLELPLLPLLIRPKKKRALHRSNEKDDVA
jgi:hypothetical protein